MYIKLTHLFEPERPRADVVVWRVSEESRQSLERRLSQAAPAAPAIQLPSRHALTRYFQSYYDKFHKHFPMLHMPTHAIDEAPPELSVAIAAIGAQYRFELSNGLELYRAAKYVVWEKILHHQRQASGLSAVHTSNDDAYGSPDDICAMILLMAFASWTDKPDLLCDALQLQMPLTHALRLDGLHEASNGGQEAHWAHWIQHERRRRAKLIGFVYLNVVAVTYDTPIMLFANEIHLSLPCCAAEWEVTSEAEWRQAIQQKAPAVSFEGSLQWLLHGDGHGLSTTTPVALFVLLQAILQKIMLARQLQSAGEPALREADLEFLE